MAYSETAGVGGAMQGASAGFAIGGPWGAAIGGAVGAVTGGVFGGKQAKAIKRAQRAAARIEAMKAYQAKVNAQRSYAQQRAEVVANAGNEGTLGASSTVAALGSLDTQVNAAFGAVRAEEHQLEIIRKANSRAAKYGDALSTFSSLTKAAGDLAGAFNGPAPAAGTSSSTVPDPTVDLSQPIAVTPQASFFSGNSFNGPSFYSDQPSYKF